MGMLFKENTIQLKCLPKIATRTECEENIDSVPNDKMSKVFNEIQGYKEMTDTTDEMSTLPPCRSSTIKHK